MEILFAFVISIIFLLYGLYVLKNPGKYSKSYGQDAGKFQKEFGWIPIFGWIVGCIYKSNAKFYQSRFGLWFLRFWGICAVAIALFFLFLIFTNKLSVR